MENMLKNMQYPGRGLVIGVTSEYDIFCSYFITGRSDSSKARLLHRTKNIISTEPTDPKILEKGNPDLLLYDAIAWYDTKAGRMENTVNDGEFVVAVSNGKQTDSILTGTLCANLSLKECTRQWNYEPDDLHTPRISGRIIISPADYARSVTEFGIIRKSPDNDAAIREEYVEPLFNYDKCAASCIATYTGDLKRPEPYTDKPFGIPFDATDAEGICEELSDMLKPELRVAVAALVVPSSRQHSAFIRRFRG